LRFARQGRIAAHFSREWLGSIYCPALLWAECRGERNFWADPPDVRRNQVLCYGSEGEVGRGPQIHSPRNWPAQERQASSATSALTSQPTSHPATQQTKQLANQPASQPADPPASHPPNQPITARGASGEGETLGIIAETDK